MAKLGLMDMDDTGMWIWAGVLLVISLLASYLVAIGWQRWRDRERA